MRTLVDINDRQVQALDDLARQEKKSRAALIRAAIDEYLSRRSSAPEVDAFGSWGTRRVDGLAYQKKVRSEW